MRVAPGREAVGGSFTASDMGRLLWERDAGRRLERRGQDGTVPHARELAREAVENLVARRSLVEERRHGGDAQVADAAGMDEVEVREIGIDVQGEAVERDPAAHRDAD